MILTILLGLLLFQLAFLVILLVIFVRFGKILRTVRPYLREIEEIKKKTAQEERGVLEEAIKSSKEIFADAVIEVKKTLKLSEKTKMEIEEKYRTAVEESISNLIAIFQNQTNTIISGYQKKLAEIAAVQEEELKKISGVVATSAKQEMSDLAAVIEREVQEVRENIETQTQRELRVVKAEIGAYREKKMREIEGRIYKILEETAKSTIGRSISLASHEELVMKALEKAKAEHIFGHE